MDAYIHALPGGTLQVLILGLVHVREQLVYETENGSSPPEPFPLFSCMLHSSEENQLARLHK